MRINDILRVGLARHDSQGEILELLSHILKKNTTWIFSHPEWEVPPAEAARFTGAIDRLSADEPLPYITQTAWFMGEPIHVDSRVLIPRPETALLVEAVGNLTLPTRAKILDAGTGSGCIAMALRNRHPAFTIIALDASIAALAVARQNIPKIPLLTADLLTAFSPGPTFDVIVSNPPYVTRGEIETLPSSVRNYEPLDALDGGQDGLDFFRALCHSSHGILRKGGTMVVETGYNQAEKVSRMMAGKGYTSIEIIKDDAGYGRVVKGQC